MVWFLYLSMGIARLQAVLHALVAGRAFSSLDHGRRGIDARQLACLGPLPGQQAEQVSGAAAYVEHSPGSGARRQGERRRPVGNVVVQAAAPTLLVTGGSVLEGRDIAVRWHSSSLAGESAPCASRGAITLGESAMPSPRIPIA